MEVHRNMSLRDALRVARDHGCEVRSKSSNGEVVIWSPDKMSHVTHNCRRKDASARLISLLRRVTKGRAVPSRTHDSHRVLPA